MKKSNEQALRNVICNAYISCIEEFSEIHELSSGTGDTDVVYLPKKGSPMPVMICGAEIEQDCRQCHRADQRAELSAGV